MPEDCKIISSRSLLRIKKQLDKFPHLFLMAALLDEMGLTGYLIGGIIRDLVLNRPTRDVDIAIKANPKPFLKKLARNIPGHFICLDEEFLTFRFISRDQHYFDFTPLKADSLLEDLLKRDFTINAMALDLKDLKNASLRLIDPLGGADDLAQGIIRVISEEVFRDDPLRILRAYRLAGQLNYRIEEKTQVLIRRDRNLLKTVASERVREELFLILALDHSSGSFELFHQNGLLAVLFTLCSSYGLSEEGWIVAIQTLAEVEKILLNLPITDHDCLRTIETMLSQTSGHKATYKPLLKLAAFLSALPHPSNWLDSFLRKLCLSTPQRKYVLACIKGQARPRELIQSQRCTHRYFCRFFRDLGEAGIGALILSLAQQRVAPPIRALQDLFSAMIGFYCDWQKTNLRSIIDGDFLLEYFHLSPGPIIGDILNFLQEAKAEGKVTDKDTAIELVGQFLKTSQH